MHIIKKIFIVHLFALVCILLNTQILYGQTRRFKIQGKETEKDRALRYRKECYLSELRDKSAQKKCNRLYEEAMEEASDEDKADWKSFTKTYYKKGKKKETQTEKKYRIESARYWFKSCRDFYPDRPKGFDISHPESCLAYGESLQKATKVDAALRAFEKACGKKYIYPAYLKSDDPKKVQKGIDRLQEYGCVTRMEEKKYKLEGIPYCNESRLIACLRVGDIYVSKEDFVKAKAYFTRACEGGVREACNRNDMQDDRWWLILYTALGGIGLAVFIFMRMLFQEQSEMQATGQLEEGEAEAKDQVSKHGAILKYSRPFFKHYISPIVSSMKIKKKIREKYKQPIASAGLSDIMTPEDFFSFKLFLIVGFPIVFMAVRTFLEESWPLKIIPALSLFGYFYPDLWVGGKIKNRQKDVINNMPFAVDMLALSVEAGLDFIMAMQKVIEKAKDNALTEEFQTVVKEIKIGASRAEALRNMAWRVDMIQISSFTATLIAADSVGASIGPILKSLSVEIRQKRSTEVEKEGATAATKILFPMMVFIMPAVFMIVFGPIVVEFVSGGK